MEENKQHTHMMGKETESISIHIMMETIGTHKTLIEEEATSRADLGIFLITMSIIVANLNIKISREVVDGGNTNTKGLNSSFMKIRENSSEDKNKTNRTSITKMQLKKKELN